MINGIEGCGKVKGYKNSTLAGIKAAKYVVGNFAQGLFLLSEPTCMLISFIRTSSTHSCAPRVSLILVFK